MGLTLEFSNVTQNNLGGSGPDAGAEELRYSGIGTYQGTSLDIVMRVKAGADYRKNDQDGKNSNGMLCANTDDPNGPPELCMSGGSMGQINLCAACRGKTLGEQTDLSLTIERTDTKTAITLPAFYITFFDIDSKVNSGGIRVRERLAVSGYSKAVYDMSNSEANFVEAGNTLTATSTMPGCSDNSDNPRDVHTLTTVICSAATADTSTFSVDQSSRSAMFLFEDTSSFDLHLETLVGKTKQVGRNFLFAFKSGKVDDC